MRDTVVHDRISSHIEEAPRLSGERSIRSMEPKGAKTHGAVKEGFVKRRRDNGLGYEDRLLHLQGAALSYSNSRNVRTARPRVRACLT